MAFNPAELFSKKKVGIILFDPEANALTNIKLQSAEYYLMLQKLGSHPRVKAYCQGAANLYVKDKKLTGLTRTAYIRACFIHDFCIDLTK